MTKHSFNQGLWRLDFSVTIIAIIALIYFFLNIFNALQINIERENVNKQVQNFRLSLTESWLSRNIAHKNANIISFENTNPMLLITELPNNYVGDLEKTPQDQKSVWFYHTKMQQLIYILSNGEIIRYQFAKTNRGSASVGLPNGGLDLMRVEE